MVVHTSNADPPIVTRQFARRVDGFILVLITLAGIKGLAWIPVYFHAFAVVAGFLFFIFYFKLSRVFYLPYLLLLVGFVDSVVLGLYGEIQLRLMHVFFMVAVAHFLSESDPRYLPQMIALILVPIAVVEFLLELLVLHAETSRTFPVLGIPRMSGLRIDPNFNAMFYGCLGILLLYGGKRGAAFLMIILSLFSLSRGTLFALAMALLTHLLIRRKVFPLFYWPLVLGIVSFPLVILTFNLTASSEIRDVVMLLSTGRFQHWMTFVNMGLENPLTGVGYFQGRNIYSSYAVIDQVRINEAHNLFIDVFGEFGILGFIILTCFFVFVANLVYRYHKDMAPLFVFLFTGFLFYDALSEWTLWVGLGFLLANVNQSRYHRRNVVNAGQGHRHFSVK